MARISPNNERTLEVYKDAGAKVRLMKAAAVEACVALGRVLTSSEMAKVRRAMDLLNDAVSAADSRMFNDHSEICGKGYARVFYGNLKDEDGTPLDKEIRRRAKEHADALFV